MRVQSRMQRFERLTNVTMTEPRHVREPVRTCVGCRGTGMRSALVRLVIDSSVRDDDAGGSTPRVVVDERKRLPGRGAWLHCEPRCWELAERRRAVPRALGSGRHIDVQAVSAWFDQFDDQHPMVLDE